MRSSISNSEPEKSAFGPLLLGAALALSLFVGGAIRTFLGPKQIRQFIEKNQRERPLKFDLVFDKASLSLSNGWLPRLGLELQNVNIKAKNICDTDMQVQIQSVYVPIYLWKSFNQQLRFKAIQFGQVELSRRAGSTSYCDNSELEPEPDTVEGSVPTEKSADESIAADEEQLDVEQLRAAFHRHELVVSEYRSLLGSQVVRFLSFFGCGNIFEIEEGVFFCLPISQLGKNFFNKSLGQIRRCC
ncbi:MAG: hypothetical protein AAF202_05955 [Pseudomonadota bacterium]